MFYNSVTTATSTTGVTQESLWVWRWRQAASTRSTHTPTGWFVPMTIVMWRASSRSLITRVDSVFFMVASVDWYAFIEFMPVLSACVPLCIVVTKLKFNFPLFSNHQHLFASEHRDDIIRSAIEHAGNFIGITLRLRKEVLSFENFMADRLGKYSSDESITSLAEFVVQKITPRHPVRALSFSFACMILINCRFH